MQFAFFVADFGLSIPETVRRVEASLSDSAAIKWAVRRGYTAKTTAGNFGFGLDELLNYVVRMNKGEVAILSLGGHVLFRHKAGRVLATSVGSNGFCPGTTIDIVLRTDTIDPLEEEAEELEW